MGRYSTKLKPKPKKKQNLAPLWLGLAGIGLVLIALWAILGSNMQAKSNIEIKGSARLKVDTEKIDHGEIKLGTPVRDVIKITNVGDQALRFIEAPYIDVKEGC
jgi:hypothetical protein